MEFLLKKGEHRSTPTKFKIYACTTDFEWKIRFSKECWYERSEIGPTGANKLRGITFGIHHEDPWGKWKITKWLVNSALIGWQPNFNDPDKKKINLYLYYDVNGVEFREIFKSVETEEEFIINFLIESDGVYVYFNDEDASYVMPTKTWLKLGYHLHPFFGGKSVAPKDMSIFID